MGSLYTFSLPNKAVQGAEGGWVSSNPVGEGTRTKDNRDYTFDFLSLLVSL